MLQFIRETKFPLSIIVITLVITFWVGGIWAVIQTIGASAAVILIYGIVEFLFFRGSNWED